MTDEEIKQGHEEQALWSSATELGRCLLEKHGVSLTLEESPRGMLLKIVGSKRYSFHQPPAGKASTLIVTLTEPAA